MGWRLARALQTLSAEIRQREGDTTIWTVGDADHQSRPSDHNPDDHDNDPDTPDVVTAIDVVGSEKAGRLWDHLQATQDVRVEYMIHAGKIAGAENGWTPRTYSGSNPHDTHIHISVGRGSDGDPTRPDLFDDPAPWGYTQGDNMIGLIGLEHGDTGHRVRALQRMLLRIDPDALPQFGDDSDYGDETASAVADVLNIREPVTSIGGHRAERIAAAWVAAIVGDRKVGGVTRADLEAAVRKLDDRIKVVAADVTDHRQNGHR